MYRTYDELSGLPRLYREPSEIKEDIKVLSERIAQINEMLNIRELLSDIFSDEGDIDLEKRAESITELLKYAEEALSELRSLNSDLDGLRRELIESSEAYRHRGGGEI